MLIRVCSLFLYLSGMILISFSASAQITQFENIAPMPNFVDLQDRVFQTETDLTVEDNESNEFISYRIRLPKKWSKSSSYDENKSKQDEFEEERSRAPVAGQNILGKIAKYYGPQEGGLFSYINVKSVQPKHKISIKNWLTAYTIENGYSLQGVSVISDKRIEVLYVHLDGAISYVVRMVAEVNGPRIVMVSYFVPEYKWEKEKAMQEKVVSSFAFVNSDDTIMEPVKTYSFLELMRFDYPISWTMDPPTMYSSDSMDTRLVRAIDEANIDGEIKVFLTSTEVRTTLSEEVGYIRKALAKDGLEVGEVIEELNDYEFDESIYFSRVEVYKGIDTNNRFKGYEYWLAVMADDGFYYIVTMFTPSREGDFGVWARNIESFETIIESFRP